MPSSKQPTKAQIRAFQNKVLSFYKSNARQLPWRATKNPYRILLSEFMLQQTQVSRVIYYTTWLKKWPTINHLASTTRTKVLKAWMGLGYNRRAMYLHEAAKTIVTSFQGDVLKAMSHYDQLKGIGEYTASVVRIFSPNQDIVTLDTNIRRILIHEFSLPEDIPDKELWQLAELCFPQGKSRDWHNALMDYGALYLTSKRTGISPKTKQSKFEGSDRQIRAKILKILLIQKTTIKTLEWSISAIYAKTLKRETHHSHPMYL